MHLEEKKINMKFHVLAIICIVLFCIALTPVTLQNDTFYTIKIGEHIIQQGIDMQDPFSWHEDLPYTYPHWAYDTGIYLIYHLGEITGIPDGGMLFIYISTIILACILGIVIYITNVKSSKNYLISFIFTIGALYLLKDFIAARAQLLTFILFGLTVLWIETFLKTKKKRYLLYFIILSIIIANVHVAVWPFYFVLFMPYIVEYLIACILQLNIVSKVILAIKKRKVNTLEKKLAKQNKEAKRQLLEKRVIQAKEELNAQREKEEKIIAKLEKKIENPYKLQVEKNNAVKWLILVVIICIFTGLLTPLGDTPYTYLVKTMQGNTTNSISEHQPLALYSNRNIMILFTLVLGVLIFTRTKIRLKDLFMVAGLMFLTFMSRRQASIFVLIVGSILAKWISNRLEYYDKNGTQEFIKLMVTWLGKIITLFIILLCCFVIWKPKENNKFIDSKKYPVEASTWILQNLDVENIRLYNEYNYGSYLLFRGIPVFIDSRADLYAPEFNKTEKREGRDIFSDYINTSSINNYYETKMEEYNITHVIVVNNAKLNMFLSRNNHYKQLYKDDYFVIYERNV